MFNAQELLDRLMGSKMAPSADKRVEHAVGDKGLASSDSPLSGLFSGAGGWRPRPFAPHFAVAEVHDVRRRRRFEIANAHWTLSPKQGGPGPNNPLRAFYKHSLQPASRRDITVAASARNSLARDKS